MQFFYKNFIFLHWKSMKIIQNTLKNREKKSQMSQKKSRVGPKKVGSVGFLETRHSFFGLKQFLFPLSMLYQIRYNSQN